MTRKGLLEYMQEVLLELRALKETRGSLIVPRSNDTLYNWASKQLKEYTKYLKDEKTSMNEERKQQLKGVDFSQNENQLSLTFKYFANYDA